MNIVYTGIQCLMEPNRKIVLTSKKRLSQHFESTRQRERN